jgi:hypothetical protein
MALQRIRDARRGLEHGEVSDPPKEGDCQRGPRRAQRLGDLGRRDAVCVAPELFLDTSRPGLGRWCSVARCGNAVNTARYRKRSRR